jgi:hypothetical protein
MTNTEKIGIFGGAGLLAFLAWFYKPTSIGTVTTSEEFDLSPYGGPTSYSDKLKRFAEAIARQEGFYVTGAIPQLANNPGDLKIAGLPTLPGTSITKFSSVQAGWNALYNQLHIILTGASSYYNLDMTIEEMSRIWTATQQEPWARNVASHLGVPVSTPLWSVLA